VKSCPRCPSENEPDSAYCDRCGADLAESPVPVGRPRYEALQRVANGLLFLSRLSAVAGALLAAGVAVHFGRRSLLVAVFFAGAAGLSGYLALVLLRAASDFLRLSMDVESHLRDLSGGRPAGRR
jgi:hypothetical protein